MKIVAVAGGAARGSRDFQTINHIAVAERGDKVIRITAYPIKKGVSYTTLLLTREQARDLADSLSQALSEEE